MNAKLKIAGAISAALFTTLLLALALFAFSNHAFGWFAANDSVNSAGMTVTAKAYACLVISENADNGYLIPSDTATSLSFGSDIQYLEPATHDNDTASYPSRLKYVSNTDIISPISGMAKGSEEFTYANAVEGTHYAEFTVYIGSIGDDLTYTNLTLNEDLDETYLKCFKGTTAVSGTAYYTRNGSVFTAASVEAGDDVSSLYTHSITGTYVTTCVDVYYNGNYITTLNPSQTDGHSCVLSESGTLEMGKANEVTLRIYFDGAMTENDSGTTILRASNQKASELFLGYSFTLTETN